MRLAAFAALTAVLVAAPVWAQPKDDKASFQGVWKITRIEYPADLGAEAKRMEELEKEMKAKVTVTVKDDTVSAKHATEKEEPTATFKLAPGMNPKEIDITLSGPNVPKETTKGIYKFEKDELVVAVAVGADTARPKEFKPDGSKEKRGGVLVIHFQKQK